MRNASKHAVWQNLLFIYIVWHNVWVRDCVSSSIATAVDIVVKTECPQNLSKQMRIDIEIQTVSKIVNGPASMSLNGDFFLVLRLQHWEFILKQEKEPKQNKANENRIFLGGRQIIKDMNSLPK